MVIVLIFGYFVFVFGLYFVDSKNNDLFIFNYIIRINVEDI